MSIYVYIYICVCICICTCIYKPSLVFTLAHTLGVILISDHMYASMLVITALAIFFFPLNLPAALATDSTNFKILVPLKLGFKEFVSWTSSEIPITPNSVVHFSGFAIEVFQKCVEKLNDPISFTLIGYGDGLVDPAYNDLVQKLVSKVLISIYNYLCL